MQILNSNVLISGGTSGVGKAIALDLALQGAHITLIGRNQQRGEATVTELRHKTGNQHISLLLGDLSTKESVNKITKEYSETHQSLDILINSLGNLPDSSAENIKVNFLSHYWLTTSLATLMSQSKDARVFVITGAPIIIKLVPVNRLQLGKVGRGLWLLSHKTLLVRNLADTMRENNIKVNALFPGAVRSNLSGWNKGLSNDSVPAISNILKNTDYDQITGEFFDNQGHFIRLNPRKYSFKTAKKEIDFYTK